MAKPPFGVLLVTGGMTHQESYGRGFQADSRCKVIGLADESDVDARRGRLNRELAEELNIPLLPDLDQALQRDDVDLVSVCSEFERRARVSEKCVKAGNHLYVDKPMATSVEDARRLAGAIEKAGVRSQMFTQVGQPYAQRAKKIVDSGKLGELRAIHCDLLFGKGYTGGAPAGVPRKEFYPPTRFTFPDAKRELWTTAVYSLTLIRWLTGREFRSVYATTANYFFEEHHRHNIEDFGALAVTLEGNLTATLTASRIGWQAHRASGPMFTRLFGSEGSVLIDAHAPRWETASDSAPWSPPPRDPLDPMGFWASTMDRAGTPPKPDWYTPTQLRAQSDQSLFLDCLEQEKEAAVTAADAGKASEVMLAAYQSATNGEVVTLPLPG